MDALRAEAVRTMYAQMPTTNFAAVIITSYMVAVSLPFTPWPVVLGWAVLPLAIVVLRLWVRRRFDRAAPDDLCIGAWANAYVAQQALVGAGLGPDDAAVRPPGRAGDDRADALLPLFDRRRLGQFARLLSGRQRHAGRCPLFDHSGPAGGDRQLFLCPRRDHLGVVRRHHDRLLPDPVTARSTTACASGSRTSRWSPRSAWKRPRPTRRATRPNSPAWPSRSSSPPPGHDLRQPLYALSLFSASLDELKLDDEGRGVVGNIQDSIGVMESLFDGLLDISKLEAGVVQARLTAVSVDALFDRISQVFLPIAIARGLDLRLRSDGEWVRSDPVLLEQVVANFVSNALRNTDTGGVLGRRAPPRRSALARSVGHRSRHRRGRPRAHLRRLRPARQSAARPQQGAGPWPLDRAAGSGTDRCADRAALAARPMARALRCASRRSPRRSRPPGRCSARRAHCHCCRAMRRCRC